MRTCILRILLVLCLGLLPRLGYAAVAQLFLFDLSGSMRDEWETTENLSFVESALLGNLEVIEPRDLVIVRAFYLQPPSDFDSVDPLRLWPPGPPAPFASKDELKRFAASTTARLRSTKFDTDLHQALCKALLDLEHLAAGSNAIIWLLTDNWQDVGGNAEGINDFYDVLATDERVQGVWLLPLLRNSGGPEGNLILYEILIADPQARPEQLRVKERMMAVAAEASAHGLQGDYLVPIACRAVSFTAPRIAYHPEPTFTPTGDCVPDFRVEGKELHFSNLKLGTPLCGSLAFYFESTMMEWRIREVLVDPATFTFDEGSSGPLVPPPMQRIKVVPGVIRDLRPDSLSRARSHMDFPEEGLIRPELGSRDLRSFFPGKQISLGGRLRLSVHFALSDDNLQLDNRRLAEVAERVHLLDGVYRLLRAGDRAQKTVALKNDYRVVCDVDVSDWMTWIGPALLALLAAVGGTVGFLALRPSSVKYAVGGDEFTRVSVRTVRPATVSHAGMKLGQLQRPLFGPVRFVPGGPGIAGQKPEIVGRELREVFVQRQGVQRKLRVSLD